MYAGQSEKQPYTNEATQKRVNLLALALSSVRGKTGSNNVATNRIFIEMLRKC